ncbi:MAG: hypothetical protein IJ925_09695 [Muribaculaceae bacterium]|jgi:hypothetical protein|nr:hypothetical protein [Muribaculaceae bacterium]
MSRRLILILVLAVLSWPVLQAEQLSLADASSIASRFMKERGMGAMSTAA